MTNYILLGALTLLTTLLIGLHANWLLGLSALLFLLWVYVLAVLLFKRPKPKPPSLNPEATDTLDHLYQRAMAYCNEIIEHYQNTQYTTRRYYIVAQLLTATLSGITPILVLVDRNENLKGLMPSPFQAGITWAMLILPGIAAVLATTSTIFNFQEEWIRAKKTAEALEALREEFVVGVSPQYQITARDPEMKQQQRKQALENFIVQVNALHLNQIDQWARSQRTVTQQITPRPAVQIEDSPQTHAPDAVAQGPSISDGQTPTAIAPQSSKALPAQPPSPSDRPSDHELSEDNKRINPDLDLTPPQASSLTTQIETSSQDDSITTSVDIKSDQDRPEPNDQEGPFII